MPNAVLDVGKVIKEIKYVVVYSLVREANKDMQVFSPLAPWLICHDTYLSYENLFDVYFLFRL